MKKSKNVIFILILILTTINFTLIEAVKATPYQIYNYGVGVSPLPAELGMNISIIGGYTLKYNSQIEQGYAIFRLRNSTQIVFEKIYTEQVDYIERIINVTLSPESWNPGNTGALAIAQLDLVIQTGGEIFTDNSSVYFYIQKAAPSCELKNLKFTKEGHTTITFELFNSHNYDYKVSGVLVNTQVSAGNRIIAENISLTDLNGVFNINFKHIEDMKQYNIKILTGESEQYKSSLFNFTVSVDYIPELVESQDASYFLIILLTIIFLIVIGGYMGVRKIKRKTDIIIR